MKRAQYPSSVDIDAVTSGASGHSSNRAMKTVPTEHTSGLEPVRRLPWSVAWPSPSSMPNGSAEGADHFTILRRSHGGRMPSASGGLLANFSDRWARSLCSARLREGTSSSALRGDAAGIAANASRLRSSCSSGAGSAAAPRAGTSTRARMSRTIFSGRLRAE
jgi:hypothetical protein